MGKKEELTELDDLVRKKMISFLKDGKTEQLSDLATPINYLAKNNVTSDKPKVDLEQAEANKRLEEAKKRRGSK